MFDYPALQALTAVVREGSFERAAQRLHITASAVSQRIKLLEERMGQVLVLRGSPCTGTEAGRALCLHFEQVILLEDSLRRSQPSLEYQADAARATLPLAVNADSLSTWFMDAVAAFSAHAQALLDLRIDDQERTAERLRNGEVLAAVTASGASIAGCNVWPLGSMAYVAAASPDFAATHWPGGVSAPSLAHAPMLGFGPNDRLQEQWLHAHGLSPRVHPPCHYVPSNDAYVRACEMGLGWGVHPKELIREQLASTRLVPLKRQAVLAVPLYWVHLRSAQAVLEPLTQCVMAAARKGLAKPAASARGK